MVDGCPKTTGPEVIDGVQVGDVHPVLIRLRGIAPVLVDVQHEQQDIGPIQGLKDRDALVPGRKLGRISLSMIPPLDALEDWKDFTDRECLTTGGT
jgi:hypothetical protein